MQQKIQFIITIIHEPKLLIFDEPFSGFDPVNAELLKKEILELKDAGHTIIFSTHNMSSVEEICDNIALINRSQVVLSGNVTEVKAVSGQTISPSVSIPDQGNCNPSGNVQPADGKRPGRNKRGTHP